MSTLKLLLCPNSPPPVLVHELIEAQCDRTSDAIAVTDGQTALTYAELDARASRVARTLCDRGLATDGRVAILAERSMGTIVAMLATLKAGGGYVPLDPSWPAQRIESMIRDSGAVAVIDGDTDLNPDVQPLPRGAVPVDARNLAYVIYTSGSTGAPKGVLVAHAQLVHYTNALVRRMAQPAGTSYANVSTFAADLGHTMIFPSLVSGGTLHIVGSHALTDAEQFADSFGGAGIDCLKIVPSHLDALLATAPYPRRVLPHRLLILGGEVTRPALLTRIRQLAPWCRVMNHYGPTETTVGVLTFDVMGNDAPLGFPLPGTTVHVLDAALQPAAEGELFIGGASVARGYHQRADLTAEHFIPDPFAEDGTRLYRTGDRAQRRDDGAIVFLGRVDHQVKIRGYRVELREIESALLSHEDVHAAVVVVRGDVLHAYIQYKARPAGNRHHESELREYLRARLPEHMLPSAIAVIDAMPLTGNGKIDRDALPAIERVEGIAPRDERERVIAEIFADLLPGAVGVEDNLLEAGGHSLLFMRAAAEIRRALGIAINVATMFAAPTVAAIARYAAGAAPAEELGHTSEVTLSLGQQRMWIVRQLAAEPALYNVPAVLRVRGPLDVAAIEAALTTIVARHDALRTIVTATGEPELLGDVQIRATLFEARSLDEAMAVAREHLRRPFDLSVGPMLRAAVIRIAAGDALLVLTTHHIASDAWSTRLLLRELEAPGVARGRYADFAAWQRRWLESPDAEASLAYWRQQLDGIEATLELPLDRPRPAVQSGRGQVHRFTLDAETTRSVRALAKRESATPFMLLLAAFHLLLHRITRQRDIVVGSPIAGREHAEVEDTIGFFVNSIALRARVDGDGGFRALLAQVRTACLGAYAHARMPFDRIVETLRPQRDLSHHPLFQVMFALQPAAPRALTLGDASAEWLDVPTGAAKFDLTFELEEMTDGLAGRVTYASDLFDAATIERMAGHYGELLRNALAAPDAAVESLNMLTAEERELVVEVFNRTAGEFPRQASLKELFEEQAARTPQRIAVVDGYLELTYHRINARANALADRLAGNGIGVDTPVGVCLERSADLVVAILAILKCGGAYVPLDLSYPEERLAFMVADSGMSAVVTDSRNAARFEPLTVTCVDRFIGEVRERDPIVDLRSEATAYTVYTSGSTGQPKGVSVPQRAVTRLVFNTNYVPFGPDERFAQISNSSFDAYTFELWGALLHGATLVIFPRDVTLSTQRFAASLRQHRITALFLTTALFNQHVRELPDVFAGVRHVLFGGEAVDPKAVADCLAGGPPQRLLHVYGPTESTTFASWHLVDEVRPEATTVPIGTPITNTTIYVLDPKQAPVPVGVAGELFIGGEGLARGYQGRPDLTAQKFVPDAFASEGGRLYRTGDLVRFLANGEIEFLGRLDDQVKVRGFRIELREVESVLAAHSGVADAAVVVREDIPGDRRLVAYVALRGGTLDAAALRAWLRAKLPEYMVPSAVVVLDALPLSANGKVDRRALPPPLAAGEGRNDVPRTETEQRLAAIWSEVLRIDPIGIHQNFFDLGGHSLLAVRVISRVRAKFSIEIPLSAMFEAPTIAALAEHVEATLWAMAGDENDLEGVEL